MQSNYQLSHDPSQQKLRHLLCNRCLFVCGGSSALAWKKVAGALALVSSIAVVGLFTMPSNLPVYRVAFIGNSMMYYNDFPRFMESLSDNHVKQDCCLHGDASLHSILTWGSGTYKLWHTGGARVETDDDIADENNGTRVMYDLGACTVEQLLFGYDADLEARMEEIGYNDGDANDDDNNNQDKQLNDDFYTYNDGTNPCIQDPSYYYYRQEQYELKGAPQFDFVVINDRTRSPARLETRNIALQVLNTTYIPWLQETAATPIFVVTYGYDTPYRDMSGLVDVPTFTSLTYGGYEQYAALIEKSLPPEQKPRLAPVGLAFLMVWEENFALWERLFHIDQIHASPHGTFLQGCVVHHTMFGRLPTKKSALRNDMSGLWNYARRLQPIKHRRMPMPTREEAEYLYHIAERVTVRKQIPKSFTHYENGEASDYIPNDGAYADNDIY